MACCPDAVAVNNSSMESTCLRARSPPTCAPICGQSVSSPLMRSTGSLAFLATATGFCGVGSDAADSLFLVAFCTDTLRESSPKLALLHCNSAALATSNDCVITQEISSWKYGLREMAWITFWMQSRPELESAQAGTCPR